MLKIQDFLFMCLIRLPFILTVYVMLLLFGDVSAVALLLPLLVIFILINILDTVIKYKGLVVLIGIIAGVAFFFLNFQNHAIMSFCIALYRPKSFSGTLCAMWIFFLCATTVLAGLYAPQVIHICIRCVLLAAVATLLSRQIQTLDRFLSSYYCWDISSKTAASLVKRVYKLTAVCFSVIIIAGFLLARPGIPGFPTNSGYTESSGSEDKVDNEKQEPDSEWIGERPVIIDQPASKPPEVDKSDPETDTITTILWYSMTAVSVVLIVMFIRSRIRRPAAYYFEDFEEELEEEQADLSGFSAKKRKARLKLGVNRTVRRLFRTKVREYIRRNELLALRSDTPGELVEKIAVWEDLGSLKHLYHRARYSEENISRNELNALYTNEGLRPTTHGLAHSASLDRGFRKSLKK